MVYRILILLVIVLFTYCSNINKSEELLDCFGNKNGSAVFDECGICNGAGIDEGYCDCQNIIEVNICGNCNNVEIKVTDCETPEEFKFNQSTLQAFYFIKDVYINNDPIDPYDWLGAFKDTTCVGSRIWNRNECGNNVCDLPAMGNNGDLNTFGYLNNGDMPIFKIYDKSEDKYYNALPSYNEIWSNLNFVFIDSLIAVLD